MMNRKTWSKYIVSKNSSQLKNNPKKNNLKWIKIKWKSLNYGWRWGKNDDYWESKYLSLCVKLGQPFLLQILFLCFSRLCGSYILQKWESKWYLYLITLKKIAFRKNIIKLLIGHRTHCNKEMIWETWKAGTIFQLSLESSFLNQGIKQNQGHLWPLTF